MSIIFSRRALQKALDALETVITRVQRQTLIARLEEHDHFAAMWEIVWLSALSEVAIIEHEAATPGGSKPDFKTSISLEGSAVDLVGDITAISDKGLHDRNPIDRLWKHIERLARKYRLNPGYFRITVEDQKEGRFGDARRVLMLPGKSTLDKFVSEHVEPIIKELTAAPINKREFRITKPSIALQLNYIPEQRFQSGGHAPYNIAYSIKNNPVFNALHAKSIQLRSAPDDAVRLLIVCDAGCGMLYPTHLRDFGSYTPQDVAQNILHKSHDIDLIMFATVENSGAFESMGHNVVCTLIAAPENRRHPRLTPASLAAIKTLLEEALLFLPKPATNAASAVAQLIQKRFGCGLQGGSIMSDNTIAISSRQVMELLAGNITIDEFQRYLGWEDKSEPIKQSNPFRVALKKGRLIASIDVTPDNDHDDDWLTVHLSEPDPAICQLK